MMLVVIVFGFKEWEVMVELVLRSEWKYGFMVFFYDLCFKF